MRLHTRGGNSLSVSVFRTWFESAESWLLKNLSSVILVHSHLSIFCILTFLKPIDFSVSFLELKEIPTLYGDSSLVYEKLLLGWPLTTLTFAAVIFFLIQTVPMGLSLSLSQCSPSSQACLSCSICEITNNYASIQAIDETEKQSLERGEHALDSQQQFLLSLLSKSFIVPFSSNLQNTGNSL